MNVSTRTPAEIADRMAGNLMTQYRTGEINVEWLEAAHRESVEGYTPIRAEAISLVLAEIHEEATLDDQGRHEVEIQRG